MVFILHIGKNFYDILLCFIFILIFVSFPCVVIANYSQISPNRENNDSNPFVAFCIVFPTIYPLFCLVFIIVYKDMDTFLALQKSIKEPRYIEEK